ncbi:unnamed protein product [Linum trigynum]|uniref:F-box domain-containing protein n=1 Tax=Linum trigynum TaxID=586398 RepID=A0AAV2E1N4_9ROSI
MSAGGGSRMQIDDGWLPEELTIEILSRLPSPSTVGRCRCVSRWWRDILSDPEFIRKSIMPPAPRTARVMIPRRPEWDSQFLLYSLRGNSYRQIKGVPVTRRAERVVRSLSVSPARCHWMWRSRNYDDCFSFVSFDMSKEAFTKPWLLPTPPQWPLELLMEHSFHMARDDESCLIVVSSKMGVGKAGTMVLDVWATPSYVALAKGKCCWIRLYNVVQGIPLPAAPYGGIPRLQVPGLWKQGKLLLRYSMDPGSELVRVFDLEAEEWGLDVEIVSERDGYLEFITYLPSTMSLSLLTHFEGRNKCRLIQNDIR